MEIRKNLALGEIKEIVNAVVDSVIIDGEYYPEHESVLIDLYTAMYACPDYFKNKEISIEEFYNDKHNNNDVIDIVDAITVSDYYNTITYSVNRKIEVMLDKLKNPLNNSLAALVNNLNNSITNTGDFLTPENLATIKPALENIAKMTNVDEKAFAEEMVKAYKKDKKSTKGDN